MKSEQPEVYDEFISLCTRSKAYQKYLSEEARLLDKALSSVNAEDALWYAASTVRFDDKHLRHEYGHLAKLAGYVGIATDRGGKHTLVIYNNIITAFFLATKNDMEAWTEYNVGEVLSQAEPASSKVIIVDGSSYLVFTWYVRSLEEGIDEYKYTRLVRIANGRYKVIKTLKKPIPL